MDQWQEHVSLEITNAYMDDDRMLEIAQALSRMESADLIPQTISDELFTRLDFFNSGG